MIQMPVSAYVSSDILMGAVRGISRAKVDGLKARMRTGGTRAVLELVQESAWSVTPYTIVPVRLFGCT